MRKQLFTLFLLTLLPLLAHAANPFVGQWNVVAIQQSVYHNDVFQSSETENFQAPYSRFDFTETTITFMEYLESQATLQAAAQGTYHMDGTALVYDGGHFDFFEVISFDASKPNDLQISVAFHEDKTNYVVRKVTRVTLKRVGSSDGGSGTEGGGDQSDDIVVSGNKIYATAKYVGGPGGLSGKAVQAADFRLELYDKNNDKISIEQSGATIRFGTPNDYESYDYCLKTGGYQNIELRLMFNKSGTLVIGARSQNKEDYTRRVVVTQNGATLLDEIVSENDIIPGSNPKVYALHTVHVEAGAAVLKPSVGPLAFYVIEFVPDGPQQCAAPTVTYERGKLRFASTTPGAVFHSTIADSDIRSYVGSDIDLAVTYIVSVYASAAGYADSDVTWVTLCWLDATPVTQIAEATHLQARPVMMQSRNGVLTISGLDENEHVAVYNTAGQQTNAATTDRSSLTIDSHISRGGIAIVKIGDRTVKMVVR